MIKKYLWKFVLLSILLPGAVACSSDDDEQPASAAPTPQIIVLYSPGGLGDQGYNDCILMGVQRFKKAHPDDVEMYQYSPGGLEEAERLMTDWLSLKGSNIPALFVVCSAEYEDILSESLEENPLTANKRMLFFESDNDSNLPVTTFRLSMYGSSYLAGVTAAAYLSEQSSGDEQKNALILLAHPQDNTIAKAGDGFRDGFTASGTNAQAFTEYLADDWTGFVSAQPAYQRMSNWAKSYDFVFPVAGGSNQGIYRYTREHNDAPLTAGMDVDQSGLSRNIVGSVIKHIDQVIYNYLETWLATGELPESAVYGLESGYTDWQLSTYFQQYQSTVEAARAEAIRKENAGL